MLILGGQRVLSIWRLVSVRNLRVLGQNSVADGARYIPAALNYVTILSIVVEMLSARF